MEQHGRTSLATHCYFHLPSNKPSTNLYSCLPTRAVSTGFVFQLHSLQTASSDCASFEPLYAIRARTRLWSCLVHFRQVHQSSFPRLTFYIRTWLIRGGMVNLFIYFYFWKVFSSFVGYQRSTQSFPTMFRPRKRGNEIFLFLWTVLISVFSYPV